MIVLVMGVAGSGKTTVGLLLAARLGWEFTDGDDFHPPANIEKMKHGIPLTDEDRLPWLQALHGQIAAWISQGRNAVLACSALKQRYRQILWNGPEVKLVYLKGTYDLILQRIASRHHHFAHEDLLASQFADLEEPADAIVVDVSKTPDQIVLEILRHLGAA
jgi:gluconokinase